MNIASYHFILFNLKILGEIVTSNKYSLKNTLFAPEPNCYRERDCEQHQASSVCSLCHRNCYFNNGDWWRHPFRTQRNPTSLHTYPCPSTD